MTSDMPSSLRKMLVTCDVYRGPRRTLLPAFAHMLIEQDLIAVRIEEHYAGWPGARLVRFRPQRDALGKKLSLDFANVVKVRKRCARAIPAGVEREDIFVEHALE